jgi:hypothetical protein
MSWPTRIIEEYKNFDVTRECCFADSLIELLFDKSIPSCFFVGNLKSSRFGLLGLNPGLGSGREKEVEAYKKYGWEKLYTDFFKIFRQELKLNSTYYSQFAVLLAGVLAEKENMSIDDRYKLLHENLVNFDLIPYHSKRFTLGFIEIEKIHLIKPYIEITKKLIMESAIEFLFINGKPWEALLKGDNPILENFLDMDNSFVVNQSKKNPSKKVECKAHFGTCLNKKLVWFDRFVTSRGVGISNDELYKAGRRIREYFQL